MRIFDKPPVRKKIDFKNIDVDKLVKETTAPLEGCGHEPFEKMGKYFFFSSGEGFNLRADYKEMDEVDKWKFVALCNTYWLYFYEELWDEKEYKEYKVQLKE